MGMCRLIFFRCILDFYDFMLSVFVYGEYLELNYFIWNIFWIDFKEKFFFENWINCFFLNLENLERMLWYFIN